MLKVKQGKSKTIRKIEMKHKKYIKKEKLNNTGKLMR